MVAFLAEAHMHEELFGHAYAVRMLSSIRQRLYMLTADCVA